MPPRAERTAGHVDPNALGVTCAPVGTDAAARTAQAIRDTERAVSALARSPRAQRDAFLLTLAQQLPTQISALLAANAVDLTRESDLTASLKGRLALTPEKILGMASKLRAVADLPDPLASGGTVRTLPSGIRLETRRVPLGLLGLVYESRPDVTIEAASLVVKSGNAAVLRGGHEALETNRILAVAIAQALDAVGLPAETVQVVEDDRARTGLAAMLASRQFSLLIPRGSGRLIDHVRRFANSPVLETGVGNCHVYVHSEANLDQAVAIVVNAKADNPSVCNAAETLLVDEAVAPTFLPDVARALADHGVVLRGCERTRAILDGAVGPEVHVEVADERDWETEYLDRILAVRVVLGLEDAIAHIARYGTSHSEAIVTDSLQAADRFSTEVDAACVYVNASTRFTDGYEFGLGAEIGISTQRLHVRGPVGLEALCTVRHVLFGQGQIRGGVGLDTSQHR